MVFEPAATLRKIGEEKPVFLALLVYLIISLINLPLSRGILLLQNTSPSVYKPHWFWIFGGIGLFFCFLGLFFIAGLYSLLSEIIYKKGNAAGILAGFCFASFPGILGLACQYGAMLLDLERVGFLCSFLAVLWMMVLQVLALREALDIRSSQAVLLFVAPVLLLLILLALLFWVFYTGTSLIK